MIVDCPQCKLRHVVLERAHGTMAKCSCRTEFRLPQSSMDSGVIKCANCGGNPPKGAVRCNYCDAHLATVRCGRCFATSIEGDQHCRACGHELAKPVRHRRAAPDAVLTCPRCPAQELVSVMVGDASMDECRHCGGEWLSHEVFQEILRDRREHEEIVDALNRLNPAGNTISKTRAGHSGTFYVKCPECRAVMDRRQFAGISRVIVDICARHGVWFDRDELSGIIKFVGEGGMKKAEEHVHKERLAEVRRERQGTIPTSIPTDHGTTADWVLGGILSLIYLVFD